MVAPSDHDCHSVPFPAGEAGGFHCYMVLYILATKRLLPMILMEVGLLWLGDEVFLVVAFVIFIPFPVATCNSFNIPMMLQF